jgi:IclR family pca regulon transcriptional regulator
MRGDDPTRCAPACCSATCSLKYSALAGGGLRRQSRTVLRGLVPDVADLASLAMLDGADVVYLERVQLDMGR